MTSSSEIKVLTGIVVKGFARVDQRFEKMDKKFDVMDNKIDTIRLELKQDIENVKQELKFDIAAVSKDIEDLAGMTAREFKAVRSEIAHKNLLQGV